VLATKTPLIFISMKEESFQPGKVKHIPNRNLWTCKPEILLLLLSQLLGPHHHS
jgi:hypothetical protein